MQKPAQQPQTPETEKRIFKLEFRADTANADSRTVTGYAALFNSPSEDMGFIEIIQKGAFTEALKTSDVRCLINHDPSLILARTRRGVGTLKLTEDDWGLKYDFESPNTTYANDFVVSLRRGDISQSSISFSVENEVWEHEEVDGEIIWTRRILSVRQLFDVSPVTYPAYADTTVAIRSLNLAKGETHPPTDTKPDEFFKHQLRLRQMQSA